MAATCRKGIFSVALLLFLVDSAQSSVGLSSASVGDTGAAPKSTAPRLLPVSTRRSLTIPAGSEFCGIDDIFNDGFEPASFLAITQVVGGMVSPGLAQDITGSPSVALTASASTSDAMIDVTGTFSGPINTGITVNGVAGYTVGGKFAVPNVPLVAGSNALSVVATTLPGFSATTSGTVTRSGTVTPIVVSPAQSAGYAPFDQNYTFLIGSLPGNATINSVAIDFRGIGSNDYNGSLASAPTSYTYMQPGLYAAKFQFTDSNNVVYTITRSIVVQDVAVQRGMLCDVLGYLKDRLTAQDATNAGYTYQVVVRADYTSMFNLLGSNMPGAVAQLGVVVNGLFGTSFAELLIVRDNNDQTRSGFTLRMTRGADGVWRISEM